MPGVSDSSAMAPSERGPPEPPGSSWAGVGGRAILASHSSAGPFCHVSPAASARSVDYYLNKGSPWTASRLTMTSQKQSLLAAP